MTAEQKLRLRQSEVRERINELLAIDERTDEHRTELRTLTTEAQSLEVEIRAAILAAPDPDPVTATGGEGAEVRSLLGRADVGQYAAAAIDHRPVEGAEAELNAALKMGGGEFPVRLLAPEVRATTDTDAGASQQGWLDRIFADTAAQFMGVSFRSVPPGVAAFPVTTAGGSAAQRGRREAAADAAWTVGVTDLKPTRNSVRGVYSIEDAARLPGLGDALQRDFQMASAEGIDRAVFTGDAGASEDTADITGLATAAGVSEETLTQANKDGATGVLNAFLSFVDGLAAQSLEDLRTVLSVPSFKLWHSTFPNANTDSLLANLIQSSGLMYRVRAGLAENTDANSWGAFLGKARGIEGAGVAAVWENARIVVDPYSGAAKGEVALTLHVLWAFGLPRASNYGRLKYVA